jgi:putative transposase
LKGRSTPFNSEAEVEMSKRSYAEINLHMTWHTKDNSPFISNRIESDLYAFIKDRVVRDPQAYFYAIGGIADHLHLAAAFFPPYKIDTWIGQLKRSSSHEFGNELRWQAGYGVVSFGTRDLDWVISYINNPKDRHRTGRISARLERFGDD